MLIYVNLLSCYFKGKEEGKIRNVKLLIKYWYKLLFKVIGL